MFSFLRCVLFPEKHLRQLAHIKSSGNSREAPNFPHFLKRDFGFSPFQRHLESSRNVDLERRGNVRAGNFSALFQRRHRESRTIGIFPLYLKKTFNLGLSRTQHRVLCDFYLVICNFHTNPKAFLLINSVFWFVLQYRPFELIFVLRYGNRPYNVMIDSTLLGEI